MRRPLRLIALALPLLWSCAPDRVTSVEAPTGPLFSEASAGEVPLVYDVEHTGASFPKPVFPAFDQLPVNRVLPDPLRSFSGGAPDLTLAGWSRRRAELKAAIEHFEIGPKPDRSDVDITAAYSGGVLTVLITRKSNLRSLEISTRVQLPAGSGPFPAVIGMALVPGNGTGSLPSDIFTSRNVARMDYLHNQVTTYAAGVQVSHSGDPYFFLYPEYTSPGNVGQYSAWSWGVSRLIDGLEIAVSQAVNPLPINLKRMAVTGCSYAGKMALFAGALDERIALTIAQESGGGGAPAWRVSHGMEPNGTVEKIDNTDGSWFKQSMKTQFRGDNVYKLPHDHHELMAMVAPRALLVTGNTDFTWLSNRSAYVSARATHEVYKTFGIADRFGFYIDGGHGHCAIPASQRPAIEAFVDKFLLGRNVNTNVQVHPYPALEYRGWMPWSDRTPPVLSLPANLVAEATGPDGAAVTFSGSASDDVSGDVPVTFEPASGSVFPIGTTTVTATARDAAGNTATGSFAVTVADRTPPALTLPASQTLEATGSEGAVATYSATAQDAVDGPLPVSLSRASGSTFPLGTTTVTATATDAAGNTATGSFTVTVQDTRAPTITSIGASPSTLWAPNHQMVQVTVSATSSDAVDPSPTLRVVGVSSSEPDSGLWDGDIGPDWEITGPMTVNLRAERASKSGRVYTITVESRDRSGNASTRTVTVTVPHNQ